MPDLLTPAALAAITERAKDLPKESWSEEKLYYLLRHGRKRSGYWDEIDGDLPEEYFANFLVNARADIPALLRHIAALEARTPAPALPADMETLLADAGYKAVLAALRQEAVDKCGGGFGAPDLNADYQLSLSLLVREVYQILNIEQHIDALATALATALRETLAREQAQRVRAEKATEQWLDADAEAGRFLVRAEKAEADLAAARKELAGLKGGAQ